MATNYNKKGARTTELPEVEGAQYLDVYLARWWENGGVGGKLD